MKKVTIDKDCASGGACVDKLKTLMPSDCKVALFMSATPEVYRENKLLYCVVNKNSDRTVGATAMARMRDTDIGYQTANTYTTVSTNTPTNLAVGDELYMVNLIPEG